MGSGNSRPVAEATPLEEREARLIRNAARVHRGDTPIRRCTVAYLAHYRAVAVKNRTGYLSAVAVHRIAVDTWRAEGAVPNLAPKDGRPAQPAYVLFLDATERVEAVEKRRRGGGASDELTLEEMVVFARLVDVEFNRVNGARGDGGFAEADATSRPLPAALRSLTQATCWTAVAEVMLRDGMKQVNVAGGLRNRDDDDDDDASSASGDDNADGDAAVAVPVQLTVVEAAGIAVTSDPGFSPAWRAMGQGMRLMGMRANVVNKREVSVFTCLLRAAQLDPLSSNAWHQLHRAVGTRDVCNTSAQFLLRAIALRPAEPALWLELLQSGHLPPAYTGEAEASPTNGNSNALPVLQHHEASLTCTGRLPRSVALDRARVESLAGVAGFLPLRCAEAVHRLTRLDVVEGAIAAVLNDAVPPASMAVKTTDEEAEMNLDVVFARAVEHLVTTPLGGAGGGHAEVSTPASSVRSGGAFSTASSASRRRRLLLKSAASSRGSAVTTAEAAVSFTHEERRQRLGLLLLDAAVEIEYRSVLEGFLHPPALTDARSAVRLPRPRRRMVKLLDLPSALFGGPVESHSFDAVAGRRPPSAERPVVTPHTKSRADREREAALLKIKTLKHNPVDPIPRQQPAAAAHREETLGTDGKTATALALYILMPPAALAASGSFAGSPAASFAVMQRPGGEGTTDAFESGSDGDVDDDDDVQIAEPPTRSAVDADLDREISEGGKAPHVTVANMEPSDRRRLRTGLGGAHCAALALMLIGGGEEATPALTTPRRRRRTGRHVSPSRRVAGGSAAADAARVAVIVAGIAAARKSGSMYRSPTASSSSSWCRDCLRYGPVDALVLGGALLPDVPKLEQHDDDDDDADHHKQPNRRSFYPTTLPMVSASLTALGREMPDLVYLDQEHLLRRPVDRAAAALLTTGNLGPDGFNGRVIPTILDVLSQSLTAVLADDAAADDATPPALAAMRRRGRAVLSDMWHALGDALVVARAQRGLDAEAAVVADEMIRAPHCYLRALQCHHGGVNTTSERALCVLWVKLSLEAAVMRDVRGQYSFATSPPNGIDGFNAADFPADVDERVGLSRALLIDPGIRVLWGRLAAAARVEAVFLAKSAAKDSNAADGAPGAKKDGNDVTVEAGGNMRHLAALRQLRKRDQGGRNAAGTQRSIARALLRSIGRRVQLPVGHSRHFSSDAGNVAVATAFAALTTRPSALACLAAAIACTTHGHDTAAGASTFRPFVAASTTQDGAAGPFAYSQESEYDLWRDAALALGDPWPSAVPLRRAELRNLWGDSNSSRPTSDDAVGVILRVQGDGDDGDGRSRKTNTTFDLADCLRRSAPSAITTLQAACAEFDGWCLRVAAASQMSQESGAFPQAWIAQHAPTPSATPDDRALATTLRPNLNAALRQASTNEDVDEDSVVRDWTAAAATRLVLATVWDHLNTTADDVTVALSTAYCCARRCPDPTRQRVVLETLVMFAATIPRRFRTEFGNNGAAAFSSSMAGVVIAARRAPPEFFVCAPEPLPAELVGIFTDDERADLTPRNCAALHVRLCRGRASAAWLATAWELSELFSPAYAADLTTMARFRGHSDAFRRRVAHRNAWPPSSPSEALTLALASLATAPPSTVSATDPRPPVFELTDVAVTTRAFVAVKPPPPPATSSKSSRTKLPETALKLLADAAAAGAAPTGAPLDLLPTELCVALAAALGHRLVELVNSDVTHDDDEIRYANAFTAVDGGGTSVVGGVVASSTSLLMACFVRECDRAARHGGENNANGSTTAYPPARLLCAFAVIAADALLSQGLQNASNGIDHVRWAGSGGARTARAFVNAVDNLRKGSGNASGSPLRGGGGTSWWRGAAPSVADVLFGTVLPVIHTLVRHHHDDGSDNESGVLRRDAVAALAFVGSLLQLYDRCRIDPAPTRCDHDHDDDDDDDDKRRIPSRPQQRLVAMPKDEDLQDLGGKASRVIAAAAKDAEADALLADAIELRLRGVAFAALTSSSGASHDGASKDQGEAVRAMARDFAALFAKLAQRTGGVCAADEGWGASLALSIGVKAFAAAQTLFVKPLALSAGTSPFTRLRAAAAALASDVEWPEGWRCVVDAVTSSVHVSPFDAEAARMAPLEVFDALRVSTDRIPLKVALCIALATAASIEDGRSGTSIHRCNWEWLWWAAFQGDDVRTGAVASPLPHHPADSSKPVHRALALTIAANLRCPVCCAAPPAAAAVVSPPDPRPYVRPKDRAGTATALALLSLDAVAGSGVVARPHCAACATAGTQQSNRRHVGPSADTQAQIVGAALALAEAAFEQLIWGEQDSVPPWCEGAVWLALGVASLSAGKRQVAINAVDDEGGDAPLLDEDAFTLLERSLEADSGSAFAWTLVSEVIQRFAPDAQRSAVSVHGLPHTASDCIARACASMRLPLTSPTIPSAADLRASNAAAVRSRFPALSTTTTTTSITSALQLYTDSTVQLAVLAPWRRLAGCFPSEGHHRAGPRQLGAAGCFEGTRAEALAQHVTWAPGDRDAWALLALDLVRPCAAVLLGKKEGHRGRAGAGTETVGATGDSDDDDDGDDWIRALGAGGGRGPRRANQQQRSSGERMVVGGSQRSTFRTHPNEATMSAMDDGFPDDSAEAVVALEKSVDVTLELPDTARVTISGAEYAAGDCAAFAMHGLRAPAEAPAELLIVLAVILLAANRPATLHDCRETARIGAHTRTPKELIVEALRRLCPGGSKSKSDGSGAGAGAIPAARRLLRGSPPVAEPSWLLTDERFAPLRLEELLTDTRLGPVPSSTLAAASSIGRVGSSAMPAFCRQDRDEHSLGNTIAAQRAANRFLQDRDLDPDALAIRVATRRALTPPLPLFATGSAGPKLDEYGVPVATALSGGGGVDDEPVAGRRRYRSSSAVPPDAGAREQREHFEQRRRHVVAVEAAKAYQAKKEHFGQGGEAYIPGHTPRLGGDRRPYDGRPPTPDNLKPPPPPPPRPAAPSTASTRTPSLPPVLARYPWLDNLEQTQSDNEMTVFGGGSAMGAFRRTFDTSLEAEIANKPAGPKKGGKAEGKGQALYDMAEGQAFGGTAAVPSPAGAGGGGGALDDVINASHAAAALADLRRQR